MKNIGIILILLCLNILSYSCSPDKISDENTVLTVGDGDGEILPPENPPGDGD